MLMSMKKATLLLSPSHHQSPAFCMGEVVHTRESPSMKRAPFYVSGAAVETPDRPLHESI